MPLFAAMFARWRNAGFVLALLLGASGLFGQSMIESLSRPADQLTLVGSRALRSPVESWLELYRRRYPRTRVHVQLYGSGLAASAIAEHRADAAPMTRPLNATERATIDTRALPVAIPVGHRPLASGLRTPLYLYMALGRSGHATPAAIALARIALSQQGQSVIAQAGFEPLPLYRRDSARAQLMRLSEEVSNPDLEG
jgi:ABC-type phosphate transport system substrate-binding protein